MHYDLIIIGAGPGGYEAAIHAGHLGLKTLLIEKNKLGGTCLNAGCIPTKNWLSAAHHNPTTVKTDFAKTSAATQRLIMRLQKGIEKQLTDAHVTIVYGEATREGSAALVNGEKHTATNIILATGSTPGLIPGLIPDSQKIFTSDSIFSLTTLPPSIAIIGAGVIGLEFADIFSSLGVKVTLYDIIATPLPTEDRDAMNLIIRNLERKGCTFKLGAKAESYDGDIILVAAGRRSERIVVNEFCETAEPGIYAIGDVNGKALYAHAATYQGIKVVNNLVNKTKKPIDLTNVPKVLYTAPQLAAVGIVTDHCRQIAFNMLGRAQAENKTEGFVKLYLNEQQQIVGCVICAENADALIGEAVVLVNTKTTLAQLQNMMHPHPSYSEIFYMLSLT